MENIDHTTTETTTETTTLDKSSMHTTENLDGGPNAEDSLGMKKNVVGPNHDKAPADNSPTTEDVYEDSNANIRTSRNEGFNRGLEEQKEQKEAAQNPAHHPYDDKNGISKARTAAEA